MRGFATNMKLPKKDIERIAELARLGITEGEKEKFREQLSSILDYVGELEEVDTSPIEPMGQVTGLENVIREDKVKYEVRSEEYEELKKKLLKNAPETQDNYVKVKAVFE